jgi:pantoate--beta-alanine ligase
MDIGSPAWLVSGRSAPEDRLPMTALSLLPTRSELGAAMAAERRAGRSIALVPTMGALHAGHLALVARARREADRCLVSIFVNPTQFAANEDLSRYPRTLDADLALLEEAGADAVYLPSVEEIYPPGFATRIVPGGPALAGLEDRVRPDHFPGVATVVAKLFLQTKADVAVFGEKDYQQLRVVTQLASDLDLPIRVLGEPTVREADGLALSSRNRYLSEEERAAAPVLHRTLRACARMIARTGHVGPALAEGRETIERAGMAVDYLELRDALTLAAPLPGKFRCRLLVAARLGSTRLIDNIAVED